METRRFRPRCGTSFWPGRSRHTSSCRCWPRRWSTAGLRGWLRRRIRAIPCRAGGPGGGAWAWYVGRSVLLGALASPIGTYDTTLFSVHMVQHLLLTMVAAPLLALGAPITLLLRVSSPGARRRIWLPLLHSRLLRGVFFPGL